MRCPTSRELESVGTGTLEAFAASKANLSVEMLQKLTNVLYPHSELDSESGMQRASNRQPAKGYIVPDRFNPTSSPFYFTNWPAAVSADDLCRRGDR
jgi:hypothetical protein